MIPKWRFVDGEWRAAAPASGDVRAGATSTRAAREATGDPRPSIEERYANRDDYLEKVRAAAQLLVEARYLLDEDIDIVISACGERYDVAVAAP